jgi:hypothetical protein
VCLVVAQQTLFVSGCPAGHEMEIVCLNFNLQSTLLATGSMDHTAKVLPCVLFLSPALCSRCAGVAACACFCHLSAHLQELSDVQ